LYFYDCYGDYAIDGSYIVDTVLTLGIGNNIEFEKWISLKYKSVNFILVDPEINVELFNSTKINKLIVKKSDLGAYFSRVPLDGDSFSYFKDPLGKFSGVVLAECVESKVSNILLKFDIEGFEFEIVDEIVEFLELYNCEQIVCELHWNWYNLMSIFNVYKFFRKLRICGMYPVWMSSSVKEFLIVRSK
jgi:hypothetical protein